MVKHSSWTVLDLFVPLDHFGTLTSLRCLATFGLKWTIFGPSPVLCGEPQSKKRFTTSFPISGLLVEPQSTCLEHKYGRNL